MVNIKKLKQILNAKEESLRYLEELKELEAFVRHLEKYIICDPYYDKCIYGEGKYTQRIENWLWLYEVVEEHSPEEILDEIRWYFKPTIDYNSMTLREICHKKEFICLSVDVKLPLDEEGKKKILEAIRQKLASLLNALPAEYLKTIMSVAQILIGINREIAALRTRYENLTAEYNNLLKQTIETNR